MYGTLKLIDTEDRIRTVTTVIPFNVITKVMNNSIQVTGQSIQMDVSINKNEFNVDMSIVGLSKTVAESYLQKIKDYDETITEIADNVEEMQNNAQTKALEAAASANLAKQWATSGVLVDNTDYSAKYYAQQIENTYSNFENQIGSLNAEISSLADKSLSNITEAGKEVIKENSGGGLELLDIGIAPCGIDETQNLRRYLNGQVIQQSQFADAVSKLKTMIGWSTETQTAALLPNLVCSEEEWQAAKTASAHSQVGKFVIDDTAGTVRLPAIVNIQGVFSLQNSGLTAPAGLPNITGEIGPFAFITAGTRIKTGAFTGSDMPTSGGNSRPGGSSENELTIDFDASNASSIYGSSDTVQQEAVQYPFFIQLATGQETEANIINEIELNNPYTLFDSKYVEAPLYNTSWLLSNNSYYTKAVYPSAYDALVVEQNTNINPGDSVTLPSGGTYVKRGLSVKLSSETFDDYDFVFAFH